MSEPASVVTDEAAQKAAERAVFRARYGVDWDSTWLDEAKRDTARQNATATASVALEAAAPLLGPRPLLDREAVDRRLETAKGHRWSIETTVDAVMELARPMPTREQIDAFLQEWRVRPGGHRTQTEAVNYRRKMRNALLALLNGAES